MAYSMWPLLYTWPFKEPGKGIMYAIRQHDPPSYIHDMFERRYKSLQIDSNHKSLLCCIKPPITNSEELDRVQTLVLCAAITEDHMDLVDYILTGHFLSHRVNVNITIEEWYSSLFPLLIAVDKNMMKLAVRLVEEHKANVDLSIPYWREQYNCCILMIRLQHLMQH